MILYEIQLINHVNPEKRAVHSLLFFDLSRILGRDSVRQTLLDMVLTFLTLIRLWKKINILF